MCEVRRDCVCKLRRPGDFASSKQESLCRPAPSPLSHLIHPLPLPRLLLQLRAPQQRLLLPALLVLRGPDYLFPPPADIQQQGDRPAGNGAMREPLCYLPPPFPSSPSSHLRVSAQELEDLHQVAQRRLCPPVLLLLLLLPPSRPGRDAGACLALLGGRDVLEEEAQQEAVFLRHELCVAAPVGPHGRESRCHRLEQRQPPALASRGEYERVDGLVEEGEFAVGE
eukprot:343320-Hanusia_phi.AAC.1